MSAISNIEIAPKQLIILGELKKSIEDDPKVKGEAPLLQVAIDKNNRTEVMTALRSLEARLESLAAIDRHRTKLQEAKYAIGYVTDDIDTAVSGALDTTKKTVIDPLLSTITTHVPGAQKAIDGMKPTVDGMKDAYAKLPTALRLPVLGAIVAGGAWLGSYPLQWLGKLVGFVSKNGGQSLEALAGTMKKTGKKGFIGGGFLGLASFFGSLHRKGTFDPALDMLKGKS